MTKEDTLDSLNELIDEQQPEIGKPAEISAEPMLVSLLRTVIDKLWPNDSVMRDFVDKVVPPISEQLSHIAAKGGQFAVQRASKGKQDVGRYIADQSMRAHLLNGLLPVLRIAHILQDWQVPQMRAFDENVSRIFISGYVLHDFLKFPGVEEDLNSSGFGFENSIGQEQLPVLEQIFSLWCGRLGLVEFLKPIGDLKDLVQDLIYIACNTQVRWGTLRNLSLYRNLSLNRTQLDLAEQLSRLADFLAYVIKTPPEAITRKIQGEISQLSGGIARLTYHHVSENRGVLTNFINSAALKAMTNPYRQPLLFAPSGVIYLEHTKLSPGDPDVNEIVASTISHIKELVSRRLWESKKGIQRDGKGIKYANYYWLFFDLPSFLELGLNATFNIIHENKKPSAGKRFEKMRESLWMPESVDLDLPDDFRVDQLAEWCYLAEKQIHEILPDFDTGSFLLGEMGLSSLQEDFFAVPRDNRAGGVGYHWYFAAGYFIKKNRHLSPVELQDLAHSWLRKLIDALKSSLSHNTSVERTDWDDLQEYIAQTLTFPSVGKPDLCNKLIIELDRYHNAKRKGRGTTQVCALCSSPFHVRKQQEAAVLFAPQVYSNKKSLNSTDAIRDICSICSMEIMLRQNLMNTIAISGSDFERRRLRYLFFYPVYFFTPETLHVIHRAYLYIRRLSVTDIKRQLVDRNGQVDVSPAKLQRLQEFLLTPEHEFDSTTDRYVRFHFPETEPVTFFFIGVPPPSRDPKDAEAWVHPTLLSLLLPLALDIKVVASESSLPLLLEANEINEIVFLDAPHAAIQYVTQKTRINIDELLPTIQRLLAAYFIHVDANSGSGIGGFDYRWQDLPATARVLAESPLYAFHYLKKWQRKQKSDSLSLRKIAQYLQFVQYLGDDFMMNHARELTQLYRQFYRAKRWNSNSILQPVTKTARAILEADTRLFATPEALADAAFGTLNAFIERAYKEQLAFPPRGSTRELQQAAMHAFVDYFVHEIFFGVFRGDKSALRGKQLNLLKNACEAIYIDEAAKDKADRAIVDINDISLIE